MPEIKPALVHRIFLISCWGERAEKDAPLTWRYQLERPRTNERYACSSLTQLVAYLQEAQSDD